MHWFKLARVVGVGAALLVGVACSSGSGGGGPGGAQSCNHDSDCPQGQGCKIESNGDNYCAPLCSTPNDCPVQNQCKGSTDQPKQECKDVGSHTNGSGVCDLYNGSFGPHTC